MFKHRVHAVDRRRPGDSPYELFPSARFAKSAVPKKCPKIPVDIRPLHPGQWTSRFAPRLFGNSTFLAEHGRSNHRAWTGCAGTRREPEVKSGGGNLWPPRLSGRHDSRAGVKRRNFQNDATYARVDSLQSSLIPAVRAPREAQNLGILHEKPGPPRRRAVFKTRALARERGAIVTAGRSAAADTPASA